MTPARDPKQHAQIALPDCFPRLLSQCGLQILCEASERAASAKGEGEVEARLVSQLSRWDGRASACAALTRAGVQEGEAEPRPRPRARAAAEMPVPWPTRLENATIKTCGDTPAALGLGVHL